MTREKTEVKVRIRSRQVLSDGTVSHTSASGSGTLQSRDARRYLLYDEISQDDPPSVTKTVIRFSEAQAEVTRRGETQSRIVFRLGGHCRTQLLTPYGSMMMDIDTVRYEVRETDRSIVLLMEYDMAAEGAGTARILLQTEITAAGSHPGGGIPPAEH